MKIPRVTTLPTRYEVWWVDANHDHDHDGPVEDFDSDLVLLPHIGYHVATRIGKYGRHIVLAGEATLEEGIVYARDLMTIPCVHVREMKVLRTKEEHDATLEGQTEHRQEHQD